MIYNIYKPVGWSSFDVVKKLRGVTRDKKVGHGGTLDPFAEGVLIIGTNSDTKALTDISGSIKTYQAILTLGEETDTLDIEGKVINQYPVPKLEKSIVESIFNCEPDESTVSISIVSPDLTTTTGLFKLSQPKWCCKE